MVLTIHRKPLPFNTGLQGGVHGLQKIIAMRLNMKTDEIGAKSNSECC